MVLECSRSGYRASKSFSATFSDIKAQISTGIIFTHQLGSDHCRDTDRGWGYATVRMLRKVFHV